MIDVAREQSRVPLFQRREPPAKVYLPETRFEHAVPCVNLQPFQDQRLAAIDACAVPVRRVLRRDVSIGTVFVLVTAASAPPHLPVRASRERTLVHLVFTIATGVASEFALGDPPLPPRITGVR
jgi:hypothetical protein